MDKVLEEIEWHKSDKISDTDNGAFSVGLIERNADKICAFWIHFDQMITFEESKS